MEFPGNRAAAKMLKDEVKYFEGGSVRRLGWWILFLICAMYALFAFDMALAELRVRIGETATGAERHRNAPFAFLLHATSGGVALIAGVLQFNQYLRSTYTQVHRQVGWTCLISIWTAGLSGIWNALYFDVPFSAKILFWGIASWWIFATTYGYLHILRRNLLLHRNWMLRSFATSLFFVTFPFWVPTLQMTASDEFAWPAGLLLASVLNWLAAEFLIRRILPGIHGVSLRGGLRGS